MQRDIRAKGTRAPTTCAIGSAANSSFRRYVLRELRRRGPLLSREQEDRAELPWKTGG